MSDEGRRPRELRGLPEQVDGPAAAPRDVVPAVRDAPGAVEERGPSWRRRVDLDSVGELVWGLGLIAVLVLASKLDGAWHLLTLVLFLVWTSVGMEFTDLGERALGRGKKGRKKGKRKRAPEDPAQRARRRLERAVQRAEDSTDALPAGALDAVHDIAATLRPLLDRDPAHALDAALAHEVHAVAGEHLPAAVRNHLRLPPEVAAAPRSGSGSSPADDLAEQLRLLRAEAHRLLHAASAADADRIAVQRRFLESKYRGSDLDLT